MNIKTLKSVLLVMLAFMARANAMHRLAQQPQQEQRIERPSSYDARSEEEKSAYIFNFGANGSVQMLRGPQRRSANYNNFSFDCFGRYKKSYLKSINYAYLLYSAGYVRSSKLILFPFHVFW